MNWYESNYSKYKISINDENLKPEWVDIPAKFTEWHLFRGSKNILINIGESWTYGESLPGIATDLKQYSLDTQVNCTFGSLVSASMRTDYYQYAVPGNCNGYMYAELERILAYIVNNFDYEKIYLLCQLTEPSREHAALANINQNHKIHNLYNRKKKINFKQWLQRYDDIFLKIIQDKTAIYNNIETFVWKNFCKFQNLQSYQNLNIVEQNWISCSAQTLGVPYEMTAFQSIGWLDTLMREPWHNIKFDTDFLTKEIEKIEYSNNFINANELHNNHPTVKGHEMWATNLLEVTGWNNV